MDIDITTRQLIRAKRDEMGLTLADLRDRSGIGISTLSSIETGTLTTVKDITLEKIMTALNISSETKTAMQLKIGYTNICKALIEKLEGHVSMVDLVNTDNAEELLQQLRKKEISALMGERGFLQNRVDLCPIVRISHNVDLVINSSDLKFLRISEKFKSFLLDFDYLMKAKESQEGILLYPLFFYH
jgi:transcriptional regulator with XRE-family HTH domain